jgi:4'-phosphopantetheinyl transferase
MISTALRDPIRLFSTCPRAAATVAGGLADAAAHASGPLWRASLQQAPPLAEGEVHLWIHEIDDLPSIDDLVPMLGADELARAHRFRFDLDRRRFIARRALTRCVLAAYLGAEPHRMPIRTLPFGKPGLDPSYGINFNASHSDGMVIVAVGHQRQVGVDVERVCPVPDALEIARGLFSEPETRYLQSLPEAARSEAFLRIWVRKESYCKAVGVGLSIPLSSFDMSRPRDGRGRPLAISRELPFVFSDVAVGRGHVAALTVSGDLTSIRTLREPRAEL